jgi:hypothetical protein
LKKKEDSIEVRTDYEHRRAKDYLTQELNQLLNNNKNDCMQTFLHQQNSPRKENRLRKLLRHLGQHKELGQEATSNKHALSLNT